MLLDEVHLLNESRGSALEAGVVSRIKMVSCLREMKEVSQLIDRLFSHSCHKIADTILG